MLSVIVLFDLGMVEFKIFLYLISNIVIRIRSLKGVFITSDALGGIIFAWAYFQNLPIAVNTILLLVKQKSMWMI